jgi:hypothetical protein
MKIVTFTLLLSASTVCAGQSLAVDPHLRTNDSRLRETLALGRATSPTLRQIIDEIDRSDVVAYIRFEHQPPHVAAHVLFMALAGGRRYLHVGVDEGLRGAELIGILAHELQHAAEIARDRSVVDVATLRTLYARIGFAAGNDFRAERFDSSAAIDAGKRAAKEMLEAAATTPAITSHDLYGSVR